MQDLLADKWIHDVSPDDPTVDVAVRSLQERLGTVWHYLAPAAERPEEDIEYVHQLRVWARRASAALELYAQLLPGRQYRWMRKQLQRVRRAANDARDCDVLIQRLEARPASRGIQRWLKGARRDRADAQEAIVAVHERLGRDGRFARRIDKLVRRMASSKESKRCGRASRFGDWAREHLQPVVEQFHAAVPADRTDNEALHQFRIRGKELRYAVELLAEAFPEELRTNVYPVLEALQDRLGDINDLETAAARLENRAHAARSASKAARWRRLLADEESHLKLARQTFWEWCTRELLQDLHRQFEAVLSDTGAPPRLLLAKVSG